MRVWAIPLADSFTAERRVRWYLENLDTGHVDIVNSNRPDIVCQWDTKREAEEAARKRGWTVEGCDQ